MKVADQLVEILAHAGIKRIYAVTGDSLNELNDAVRRQGKIQWIHVRHEEAGAFAAAADGELSGLGCCAGSSGPGHVHLLNGLYEAHRSGIAVLAIVATCATSEFGSGYFQETNTIKLFDDCSNYNQLANTASQAPRMAQAAIQHAVHKKGVAVLGLPGDVAGLKAVDNVSSSKNYFSRANIQPYDEELEKVSEIINKHSKICIFCGIGASDAHSEIVKMAALLKAPVGFSLRGKMAIQPDNPNEVGMTGLLGLPSAYHSMHESDLILLLGTDFPYLPFIPQNKIIIQVDIQPEKLGRRAIVDIGLFGDIKTTLRALIPLLNPKIDSSFLDAQLHIYQTVKEHLQYYVLDKGVTDRIHPEAVTDAIDKLAKEDSIFTVDTGMCCVWAARYITPNGKRKLLGSFIHGSMANAMPQAIGAAFAFPERQIVALCGDGGISMLLGDLATIKQYNLNIKIIVFNNRSLGMVKLEMEVAGLMDNQTDMVNPDFGMVAKAMGFKGISLHNPDNLDTALGEAFSVSGPVLVDIFTDPNALSMPPKIEMKMMEGMLLSMTKLMLGGKFEEVLQTVKSNYRHLGEIND